jgi:hypothetical protein
MLTLPARRVKPVRIPACLHVAQEAWNQFAASTPRPSVVADLGPVAAQLGLDQEGHALDLDGGCFGMSFLAISLDRTQRD